MFKGMFYRPQRSWDKVIFSQASVILFTGGGLLPGGLNPPPTATATGGTHPTGMHSCSLLDSCEFLLPPMNTFT